MLKRNVLWWMLMFQFICYMFIAMSMNIAIVSMVNRRDTSVEDVSKQTSYIICPNTTSILNKFVNNSSSSSSSKQIPSEKIGFDWSETEQSTVLSGYFRFNYFSILLGGILSYKYGSKTVIGYATVIISATSALIPITAVYGYEAVVWMRAVQGVLGAVIAPTAVFTIIGNWSPPQERGKFGSTLMIGFAIGDAIGGFTFGYICEYVHWKYVFYLSSCCGIIWSIFWYLLVHDSPSQHPTISTIEREYIEKSLNQTSEKSKPPIPWKKIITNVPLLICIPAVSSAMWSFIMFGTYSPLYLKTTYGIRTNEIGIIVSISSFIAIVAGFGVAYLGDLFVEKRWLSITGVRKLFTLLGSVIAALPMIIIAFTKCNLIVVITCILSISIIGVFGNFGAPLTVLDLSPKFCGVMEGIISTSSAVHFFVLSNVVNYMTKIWSMNQMWTVLFSFTALYCIFTNLVFIIFGTSEIQPWNFEPVSSMKQNRNSATSTTEKSATKVLLE